MHGVYCSIGKLLYTNCLVSMCTSSVWLVLCSTSIFCMERGTKHAIIHVLVFSHVQIYVDAATGEEMPVRPLIKYLCVDFHMQGEVHVFLVVCLPRFLVGGGKQEGTRLGIMHTPQNSKYK